MSWQDRLRQAAYTSPSGVRFVFSYEDVSQAFDKRTSAFNFPDADGTYIQDLGRTGRRYPLRVFFWGEDYDLEAEAFMQGLEEAGIGRLEHPIYGVVDVVPFGSVTRRDALKSGANQAIIEAIFWDTIGTLYPTAQADPVSAVQAAVDEFKAVGAQQFAEDMDLSTISLGTSAESKFSAVLGVAKSALDPVAKATEDVGRQFDAIFESINNSIDTFISDPLTIAVQAIAMVQIAGQSVATIGDRLEAYGALTTALISGNGPDTSNDFHNTDLYALSSVTGAVVSVINTQFQTKPAAISAAEALLNLAADVTVWRDAIYEDLDKIDTGEAYQAFQEAVALAAGFLVEISFTLAQERRIVLNRARTIIDLSAELYGEVDSQLDFLIDSNNLSGSEILEIPAGREIVYYV